MLLRGLCGYVWVNVVTLYYHPEGPFVRRFQNIMYEVIDTKEAVFFTHDTCDKKQRNDTYSYFVHFY